MDSECSSLVGCIRQLDKVAPDAPLLALGQTVLWDEPMKAGVALALRELGSERKFVAGVHDTDYFAKLPGEISKEGGFRAVPHNATTTRALWSAAGEFSALFGSETVISKQDFLNAGLNVVKVQQGRPGILDQASEAFGWRGIVSTSENPPVVAEMPLAGVYETLLHTLQWALDETLDSITGSDKGNSTQRAQTLIQLFRSAAEREGQSLASFYRELLPHLLMFASGNPVEVETTTTTELLKFNLDTCELHRFHLVERFFHPETRDEAVAAYNEALSGSEIYGLDRFGSGAIPFDLYIPGKGRGTLRIGNRAITIMTPTPLFVSIKHPLRTMRDLASAIESKFGRDCVLIGKAVTLIGMLGCEFVFVFHEGASSYVKHTRKLHEQLDQRGIGLEINPILRIKYSPWDALDGCCSWFKLPEPLVHAFGTEEICAPSFASRWRAVQKEQSELLVQLGKLRRPMDLIRFLDEQIGGSWNSLATEYEALHHQLAEVTDRVRKLKEERIALYERQRELRISRAAAENEKGRHFRERVFERTPSEVDIAKRQELSENVERIIHEINSVRERMHASVRSQMEVVADSKVLRVHERRRAIELEAELKRMRLIRDAVIVSRGLVNAGRRPSAWWFPVICPSGHWFGKTISQSECYLEALSPGRSATVDSTNQAKSKPKTGR